MAPFFYARLRCDVHSRAILYNLAEGAKTMLPEAFAAEVVNSFKQMIECFGFQTNSRCNPATQRPAYILSRLKVA